MVVAIYLTLLNIEGRILALTDSVVNLLHQLTVFVGKPMHETRFHNWRLHDEDN